MTEGKLDRAHTKHRIREVMDDGAGFWRPCSGCQEGIDGYVSARDYPFDPLFLCQPGSGCHECGGLGVLWDSVDYEQMVSDIVAAEAEESASIVDTIVAERAGILSHGREKARQAEQLVGRSLTSDEAALVQRTIRVFADEIATGLHRTNPDPAGVRAAMREVVRHV